MFLWDALAVFLPFTFIQAAAQLRSKKLSFISLQYIFWLSSCYGLTLNMLDVLYSMPVGNITFSFFTYRGLWHDWSSRTMSFSHILYDCFIYRETEKLWWKKLRIGWVIFINTRTMQQKFDKCNITVLLHNRTYVLCVLCIQPRFILLRSL